MCVHMYTLTTRDTASAARRRRVGPRDPSARVACVVRKAYVDALARERRCLIYPELGQTTATN